MKNSTHRLIQNLLVAGVAAGLVGLALVHHLARDPLQEPADAATAESFQAWRLNVEDRMTVEQKRWLDEALTEISLREMGVNQVSGQNFINDAVRADVNGRTAAAVIREGFGWRMSRLRAEMKEMEANRARNHRLTTNPGDSASRDYLDAFDARLAERLRRSQAELDDSDRVLAANAD